MGLQRFGRGLVSLPHAQFASSWPASRLDRHLDQASSLSARDPVPKLLQATLILSARLVSLTANCIIVFTNKPERR